MSESSCSERRVGSRLFDRLGRGDLATVRPSLDGSAGVAA